MTIEVRQLTDALATWKLNAARLWTVELSFDGERVVFNLPVEIKPDSQHLRDYIHQARRELIRRWFKSQAKI